MILSSIEKGRVKQILKASSNSIDIASNILNDTNKEYNQIMQKLQKFKKSSKMVKIVKIYYYILSKISYKYSHTDI